MASGSATGNPRNKVALKPGHSLMDWIRLGNSGKDLTGVGGVFTLVTKAELAEHNSLEDAWLCIRGIVYNVTHYMDFHPGGCDELMRGVGKDATNLFNQVHAWVNYESILKKCVVGRIAVSDEEFLFSAPSSPSKSFSSLRKHLKSSLGISSAKPKKSIKSEKVEWFQQLASIVIVFNTKVPDPQVQVLLPKPSLIQCRINGDIVIINLEAEVCWPASIAVDINGKVQLQLKKKKENLWENYGQLVEQKSSIPNPDFWPGRIVNTKKVTHDSYLITLKYSDNVYNYVPPGYHIVVKKNLSDIEARPYTPVPTSPISESTPPGKFKKCDEEINLIVKVYRNGFMSSWISSQPSTTIFISNPTGLFKVTALDKMKNIYFFAGGTGITPMIGVFSWVLQTSSDKIIKLIYFNKTTKDIIWMKELDDLANCYTGRFTITHILSQPDADWKGLKGHVNLNLMKSILTSYSEKSDQLADFVCICGPQQFAQTIEQFLLKDFGFTTVNYFSFNGSTNS